MNVLIVEDNPGDAVLLKGLLERVSGRYTCTVVDRLSSAEIALRDHDFGAVVLDLALPDNTGVDTVHRIRGVDTALPIVVLTGHNDDALAQACLDAGAQDFLPKSALESRTLERAIAFAVARSREVVIREAQIRELKGALDRVRGLSSKGVQTSVTARLAGSASLRDREPATFAAIVAEYQVLIPLVLDALIVAQPRPTERMRELVTRCGDLACTPRDMIDIHVSALDLETASNPPTRAKHLAIEGRLMAIEMMGFLVDYYRVGVRRLPRSEP